MKPTGSLKKSLTLRKLYDIIYIVKTLSGICINNHMEFIRVRDKGGASRRHYKRICGGCGRTDWVLSTRRDANCPKCPKRTRTKESYSKVAKANWAKPEYRKNHADAMEKAVRRGPEHHWWNGGKAKPRSFTPEYMEWRKKIYERDDFTCQKCGEVGGNLNAHHIKSWAKHPDLRYIIENGITLCYGCHRQEHRYANK